MIMVLAPHRATKAAAAAATAARRTGRSPRAASPAPQTAPSRRARHPPAAGPAGDRPASDRGENSSMPKMKSHTGMGKRVRVTGSGKIMHEQAGKRHLLEGKSSTRTRRLTGTVEVPRPTPSESRSCWAADARHRRSDEE